MKPSWRSHALMAVRGARGFSLLEVTVALVFVAILLGIAVPRFSGYLSWRRLQNGAFLVLNDLRLAQHSAVAQSGDGPRVEVCFRADGYDIYAVKYLDPTVRCDDTPEPACLASGVETIKTVMAGNQYDARIALTPSPLSLTCHISVARFALAFLSSGWPLPNGGFAQLQITSQRYCVDIEPTTGRVKVREKALTAAC